MNRTAEQITAEIAELESRIEALKAEREELKSAKPEITYTATDKKRVFVNGELIREQGGKSIPARVKVVAYMEKDYVRNADGTMKRDENGRGYRAETGNVAYAVKFSNVDARKLRDQPDGMVADCKRVWTEVIELS
ncbi:hypothetical protein [Brevibacterium sp. SMBL_HHYL_HB1]|uniref:hypothetical protein n=1 Tax=Brevibacterium sp. SMBL_HHYL_HB1 TaxID=2777556 RepID=UPI001BA6BCDD|nr:hypothetical protein [Brevibacterium sp. SMBL_HHYL_HB1]QUL79939.1 hypothetical protein IG171_03605 [Brevibacterium sp. SMBL_HHYL_HB1]